MNATQKAGTSLPIQFQSPDGLFLNAKLANGEPIFLAADICKTLGLDYINKVMDRIPDDEKLTGKVFRSGQEREMWFVTEPGMYRLIFRSNKPEAEKFKRWVFHEVLPQIRKTGQYSSQRKKYVETDEEKTLFILIAMHLRVGDIKQIAEDNGWSRHRVSRVKRGITVDIDILKALSQRAAYNQKHPLHKYGEAAGAQLNLFAL